MEKNKDNYSYLNIKDGKITTKFTVFFLHEDGFVNCYIPSFDIYYSAPNDAEAKRRAPIMMKSFFNFWLKNEGWKSFLLQVRKLGFAQL